MEAPISDVRKLVEETKAGNLDAFTRLYDIYHGFLFHFSLKFLKSRGLAEEVVHDVFLKVWENRHLLDPERCLEAYLATICKNQIFNILKKANREAAIMDDIRRSLGSSCNDTEETVFAAELEQMVDQIVDQLPTQRRRVFQMYRFEEMNLDEIAEKLSVSKGTVKDHMAKANRFVRQHLRVQAGLFLDLSLLVLAALF